MDEGDIEYSDIEGECADKIMWQTTAEKNANNFHKGDMRGAVVTQNVCHSKELLFRKEYINALCNWLSCSSCVSCRTTNVIYFKCSYHV